jgi:hypothetical protein
MMPYTIGKVNDILVNFEEFLDFLGILMIALIVLLRRGSKGDILKITLRHRDA